MDDITLMRLALAEAEKAAALGEVPVGAVVAKDGEPVAVAHNTRETGKNATHHAELLAIDAACRALGGWRLWQCELFVTLEPCPMCAGAIVNSRIKRVVYGARDAKAGCCGSVTDLFALPFNHRPQVEGGLLEDECAALLAAFFEELRRRRRDGSKPKWKNRNRDRSFPRHRRSRSAGAGRAGVPCGRVLPHPAGQCRKRGGSYPRCGRHGGSILCRCL